MTITIAPGLSYIVPTRSAGTSQTRHCPMISAVHTSRVKNVFLADICKIQQILVYFNGPQKIDVTYPKYNTLATENFFP